MSEDRVQRDGESGTASGAGAEPADVEDLLADLRELDHDVDSSEAHEEIRKTEALLRAAGGRGLIDSGVRQLDARDAAQALVGSVVFASPLLVEDGIFDIASHLFAVRVAGVPVFLVANVCFVVLMTYALVEWTGRDRTEGRPGDVVPTRVLMVLAVSFSTSAVLMGVWGRIGPWLAPSETLARITVLWTVASLGAALGDIVSGDDGRPVAESPDGEDAPTDEAELAADLEAGALVAEIDERFDALAEVVEEGTERRELSRIERRANAAVVDDLFGARIDTYTSRDVAEAFVGSVIFAIPLLVEDGVFDVAEFFLSLSVGGFPVVFLAHAAFVLATVAAILYWTGPQDVQVTRPIFGLIPRRLVGIAVVSFLTAAALMTMWGRVEGWADPVEAVARISAVWAVAAFGAALGDILPGESSGEDINDQLAELGDLVAEAGDGD